MSMDLSDLSHSYPFLHLSRKFGVPYSVVLRAAELFDCGLVISPGVADVPTRMLGMTPFGEAVLAVCRAPWRWDMSRVQERGL